MDIENIAVVGSGQMGTGIAQVCLTTGFSVTAIDVQASALERAVGQIKSSLDKNVEKGKISETDRDKMLARLRTSSDFEAAADADFIIEAVNEDIDLKMQVFGQLDKIVKSEAIFASNTSALSITTMATATARRDRFAGMHFFHPVPVMKLVEIVRGQETSEETITVIRNLALRLGKDPVVAKDYPGFLSTRLGIPYMNEAFYAVYEGRGSVEDIDKCAKLGLNHPMGPLELADFIGLDTVLSILENLYHNFGESKYFPCPLLRNMVKAGQLGRKSGRGFYNYN